MANIGNIATLSGLELTDSGIDLSTKADLVDGVLAPQHLPPGLAKQDDLSNGLNGKVPNARTMTINGVTYDLSTNRSWSIDSMVYPAAGIPISTGTAWGTSITDNSANWNTAYGWGNHASQGYATQSYVNTQVSNLVAAAPATLDTLNELAAALGNDSNFAATIAASIGTKQAQLSGTGFVKISGTTISYDNTTYLTGITSSQVTTALGYTPYNSSNPNGYITSYTETDTLATVTARGASTSTAITMSGGSGTTATLVLDRNIGTPSNYWAGLQLEVRATSGTAGIGLHRNGYSHVGIYHDSADQLKFAMNSGTPILGATVGTIIGSGNYNSYAPTLTGGGASGTWGINVTGYSTQLNGYGQQTEYTILTGPANGPVIKVRYDGGTANRYIDIGSKDGNGVYYEGFRIYNGSTPTWGGNTILHAGNYSSYALPLSGGVLSGGITFSAPGGSILLKHAVSEVDAWIFQENAANWGLYWKNAPTGNHTFGGYTSVGAELFGMSAANSSGNGILTSNFVGATSAYAQWMMSNYTGYIWSASTIFAAGDMRAPQFRFTNSTNNAYLTGASDWGFRVVNDSGYIQFGPANGSWSHIYSDKAFYFNQQLYINGTQVVTNSGTWSIAITGNAASVGGRTVGNGKDNVGYFDSNGNLYINNPESYSGEVRLGAAWGRGGVYASSTLSLNTNGTEIHFVFGNATKAYVNNGGSIVGDGTVNFTGKGHYLGASNSWDGVGFGSLTNLHFQGHNQFWMGAGNAYWYRGGISTEHDLLITTMQGYDTRSYYRGITFAVDVNGNGNSGGYRLGRWVTYNTDWKTSRLHVDGSLLVGYGARGTVYTDESDWPRDKGLWSHGRDVTGYGNDRQRGIIFSPFANGGGPWGSFNSLEVSTINDGNNDIPALFRIHQWGSGAAEFWKPQGQVLYLRESPIGDSITHGNWFTRFHVQREIYSSADIVAYASDKRLKENYQPLKNAVEKIMTLTGLTFDWKAGVKDLGFDPRCKHEVGVLAQDVEAVLPEAVKLAPFDDDGKGNSISGERYLTVKYEKIVPLLIQGIKEQQTQIESQKNEIDQLKDLVQQLLNRQ